MLARLLFGRRYDGVVFLTTPPLISLAGRVARALRGQRYGIWSMDLHPEAEIAAGMLRRTFARSAACSRGSMRAPIAARTSSSTSARTCVTACGAKAYLTRRSHTVNIWGGRGDAAPTVSPNPLTSHLELEDRFVVMYSGNAGVVHDFGAIFEAMRRLRDEPRIYFLFVGDGPRRAEVEAFAQREGLTQLCLSRLLPA